MKTNVLVVAAAGLLFAAQAAWAAPSESERYAEWASARSGALLRRAGIDADANPISVRASVSLSGAITGVRVLRSSGSRQVDAEVVDMLTKIIRSKPPSGLVDGAVTLNLGKGAIVQAQAR